MIGRRALLMAAPGALLAQRARAALPVPTGDNLAFRMLRHGSVIGEHHVTFAHDGNALRVHIAVQARVTLLSVPIVRYTHRATETWQGESLFALDAETDKNGQREWAQAERGADGLLVRGSRTKLYTAPGEAIATSYWNQRMLDGPMISLEDGVLLRPSVTRAGRETVPLASGASIEADLYRLRGAFDVDVWYDATNTWAGLGLTVADGSVVHYERLS